MPYIKSLKNHKDLESTNMTPTRNRKATLALAVCLFSGTVIVLAGSNLSTGALLRDTEVSTGNILRAGTWGIPTEVLPEQTLMQTFDVEIGEPLVEILEGEENDPPPASGGEVAGENIEISEPKVEFSAPLVENSDQKEVPKGGDMGNTEVLDANKEKNMPPEEKKDDAMDPMAAPAAPQEGAPAGDAPAPDAPQQ